LRWESTPEPDHAVGSGGTVVFYPEIREGNVAIEI